MTKIIAPTKKYTPKIEHETQNQADINVNATILQTSHSKASRCQPTTCVTCDLDLIGSTNNQSESGNLAANDSDRLAANEMTNERGCGGAREMGQEWRRYAPQLTDNNRAAARGYDRCVRVGGE